MNSKAAMMKLLHRVLLGFSPENAHRIVGILLSGWQPWARVQPLTSPVVIPGLPCIKFPNRVGLAAGFDKNASWVKAMHALGFGFVEVGTVTPLAQPGNTPPRLWRLPERKALVNRMGFNNCGLDAFRTHLLAFGHCGVVFANLGKGHDTPLERAIEDYRLGFQALHDVVDGFVINVSSPNTAGLRSLQTPRFLGELVKVIPKGSSVFIKFAPDLLVEEYACLLDVVAVENLFTGVVLANTSVKLAKECGYEEGGLSGPPLLERALEMVAIARKALPAHKVIIGVGGISGVGDAKLMREAGADLIEVYSAFIYEGPMLIQNLVGSLA